ncbi:hypothetical protein STEG23_009132 [Scotinomys teguina]
MLERMWSKRNTSPLLVGMQIGTTTLESSMANSQKIGNHSSSRPSHTTLGHIPKECPVIPQGHMLNYVHSSTICNNQNLETTQMPFNRRIDRKMWYIQTMEYYTAEKNNDIMKFAGKWMDLENINLSEDIAIFGISQRIKQDSLWITSSRYIPYRVIHNLDLRMPILGKPESKTQRGMGMLHNLHEGHKLGDLYPSPIPTAKLG